MKRGFVRSCHFRGNVCGEVNLPARCSHEDLLEDRLTHCGHSLDARVSPRG